MIESNPTDELFSFCVIIFFGDSWKHSHPMCSCLHSTKPYSQASQSVRDMDEGVPVPLATTPVSGKLEGLNNFKNYFPPRFTQILSICWWL